MYGTRQQIDPRLLRMAQQLAAREVATMKQRANEQRLRYSQHVAALQQELDVAKRQQVDLQDRLRSQIEGAEARLEQLAQLEQQVVELDAKAAQEASISAELKAENIRLHTDFENSKKRIERSHAQRADVAKETLLRDFIGVMDNLNLALRHAAGENDQIRDGVEATVRQWQLTLEKHGIRPIDALNQPFDPTLHEAVSTTTQPDIEPNQVVHVEQTGYLLGNKLLRPARVVVSQEETGVSELTTD